MIIFDLTNGIFKYWCRFEFCDFDSAVHISCSKLSSNKVISDISMAMDVIPLKIFYLIYLIVFSNIGSGSKFSASILLFILSCSKFSSKDSRILEICFSCTRNFDGSLTDISVTTSVDSARHSIYESIGTSYFSICFNSWFCCSM